MWVEWQAVQEWPMCQYDRPLPVYLWHGIQIYWEQAGLCRCVLKILLTTSFQRYSFFFHWGSLKVEWQQYVTVCFSASQTSTSVLLRMVAVRLSAPTQRVAMSAAATVVTPWCLIWEAALVSSFASCLSVCHSVITHLLSCVCYSEAHSRQFDIF